MPRSHHRLSLAAQAAAPEPTSSREAAAPPRAAPRAIPAGMPDTFTASLIALDSAGQAWVEWQSEGGRSRRSAKRGAAAASQPETSPARSTVALATEHVGREVLVCRANRGGELIIIGVLHEPSEPGPTDDPSIDLLIQRRRVVIAARTEVVLRCGEGSITLSADGKVAIRGVDVVSTAARTQRIRGGAVRIN